MTINEFILELKNIGIDINDTQLNQLNKYYEILVEWNSRMNLTGITVKEDVYLKHFYDSLTLNKIINLNSIETLCDIGTGAGFPGLVLKIVFPNLKITLVDSLNKRIKFLNTVIETLNLTDIDCVHERAEDFARKNRNQYDIVTARAVAPLNLLIEYCVPVIKVGGYFIPMKANIDEELVNSANAINKLNLIITDKKEFFLPIENSRRNIVKFKKTKDNLSFPRNINEIKKKPL